MIKSPDLDSSVQDKCRKTSGQEQRGWKTIHTMLEALRPLLLIEDVDPLSDGCTPPQLKRLQSEYRQDEERQIDENLAEFKYHLHSCNDVVAVVGDRRVELVTDSLLPVDNGADYTCSNYSISCASYPVSQIASTMLKLVLIVGFIVAGLVAGGSEPVSFAPHAGDAAQVFSQPFAISLVFVMYSYSGWNAATYIVSEIKDPQRNIPRAFVGGVAE